MSMTALHYAATGGHPAMVKLLLTRGADRSLKAWYVKGDFGRKERFVEMTILDALQDEWRKAQQEYRVEAGGLAVQTEGYRMEMDRAYREVKDFLLEPGGTGAGAGNQTIV